MPELASQTVQRMLFSQESQDIVKAHQTMIGQLLLKCLP